MKTLLFDTETTGLIDSPLRPNDDQPEVIEFYGELIDDDGVVIDSLEFLCRPAKMPISAEIERITGIKSSDLEGLEPFSSHVDSITSLMSKSNAVCAHNLAYDFRIMELEAKRLDIRWPWPTIRFCTVVETEQRLGRRLSLSALHEQLFGAVFTGAHRAREDVAALRRVVIELRQRGEL